MLQYVLECDAGIRLPAVDEVEDFSPRADEGNLLDEWIYASYLVSLFVNDSNENMWIIAHGLRKLGGRTHSPENDSCHIYHRRHDV